MRNDEYLEYIAVTKDATFYEAVKSHNGKKVVFDPFYYW